MSEENGSILDFSTDIAEAEAPIALPAGDYPAKITGAEVGTSKAGKRMINVTFTIAPEDFPADYEDADSYADGKSITAYIGAEDTKSAKFRLRKFCESIGVVASSRLNVNEWIGKKALISITQEEFEGVIRERYKKAEAL